VPFICANGAAAEQEAVRFTDCADASVAAKAAVRAIAQEINRMKTPPIDGGLCISLSDRSGGRLIASIQPLAGRCLRA
jgi:hypothetical protein